MANKEHLKILNKGTKTWNKWREQNPHIKPDLSFITYTETSGFIESFEERNRISSKSLGKKQIIGPKLKLINFKDTNLSEADLKGADLRSANFEKAILFKAFLTETDLYNVMAPNANFNEADLRNSNLIKAVLTNSSMVETDLYRANLWKAQLDLTDLCRADLSSSTLNSCSLVNAKLIKTNLRYARLVDSNFSGATLDGCFIYGSSIWNINLNDTSQSNLIITRLDEPVITVDNVEVAQFIYLLLNHKKLRDVLNSIIKRGVLILGRFEDGGLEILRSIADKLRELQYIPIIFDFEKPKNRNFTETVKTLVSLSRFVIVDLSGPSVPQELGATVPYYKVPFVPIIEKSRHIYSMFIDQLENDHVIKPIVEFENKEQLMD